MFLRLTLKKETLHSRNGQKNQAVRKKLSLFSLAEEEEEEAAGALLYCTWERRKKRSSKVGLMRINGTRRR